MKSSTNETSFYETSRSEQEKREGLYETIKLIYPQWQGGDISHWFKSLDEKSASQGYFLGARLLQSFFASNLHQSFEVPVGLDYKREVKDGVLDKKILLKQCQNALEILYAQKPNKIITLGGECAVSVPPFSYLAKLYKDDLALLWLDAHPDIGLPNDEYKGFHAMALSLLLGYGDKDFLSLLPAKIKAENALIVGLHSEEAKFYAKRQKKLKLKSLSAKKFDEEKICKKLTKTKATKLLVHFDLDVLDIKDLYLGVGNSGKIKLTQIQSLLTRLEKKFDIVGFTLSEYLPKELIRLKNALENLAVFKGDKNVIQ